MKYNFDEIIDRSGTDALKWEALQPRWGRTDLLPLWVADMEFKTPSFVVDAVRKRIENEVFGYTFKPEAWFNAIINWQEKRNGWKISKNEIAFVPGIVPALSMAVQTFTKEGDKVLVQQPVYYPFMSAISNNNRVVVNNSLVLENGQYSINFTDFEEKVKECKLFILCNPHNPGGRVWSEAELQKIAEICYKYKVLVVSDEIHSDLTLSNFHFQPFATVSPLAKEISLTFNSASKAFNMAGFASAYAISQNPEILQKFNKFACDVCMTADGNIFAFNTTISAYTQGEEWLHQLIAYVEENIKFVEKFLQENTPKIIPILPQASYLIFLDCRKLELSHSQVVDFFVDKAHLALNDGITFGKEGSQFMRINVACPRSFLQQAMEQIKQAYDTIYKN